MPNFKVGDRVYVDGYTIRNDRGEKVHVKGTGVINGTKFAPDVYSVKMDKPYINQHYSPTTFFSALPHELFTIKKEEESSPLKNQDIKLVFYTKARTVHCKLFGAEGLVSHTMAACSPDDTFDFLTGVQIALQRMLKTRNKELVLPALKNIKFIDFN